MRITICLVPTLTALLTSGCVLLRPAALAPSADLSAAHAAGAAFAASWGQFGEAGWMGPDCWPHPVADWRSTTTGAAFTSATDGSGILSLATWAFDGSDAPFQATLDMGDMASTTNALCGILFGLDHPFGDVAGRLGADNAALLASVNGRGAVQLQIVTNMAQAVAAATRRPGASATLPRHITLRVYGRAIASSSMVVASGIDTATGEEFGRASLWQLAPTDTRGHLAVVTRGGGHAFRIARLEVKSKRLIPYEDCDVGPILGAWFRYDGNALDMTAQLMPMPRDAATGARLQILQGLAWNTLAIGKRSTTDERLHFHVRDWPVGYDLPYRIAYDIVDTTGMTHTFYWGGAIPRLPLTPGEVLIGMLPMRADCNMPHTRARPSLWPFLDPRLPHLVSHAPDLICFQPVDGNPIVPAQQPPSQADYDWLLTYRDVLRDTPALGVDVNRTRHGRLYIGVAPSGTAPEEMDPEADWQRWRGADAQVLLAPDMFAQAALQASPPDPASAVRPALATADSGLGFVAVNTLDGRVTLSRRLYADTVDVGACEEAEGWPIAPLRPGDRDSLKPLPAVQFSGIMDPVIQTIDEATGRLVRAERCRGSVYLPRVAKDGFYRVRIGDPDADLKRELEHLAPLAADVTETLTVTFGTP